LAGISWAISVIIAKKIREEDQEIDLLTLTTWQMFFGSIPLVIVALFVYEPPINWTASYIGALAYNAVPANALAWLLWLYILKKLSAGVASLSTLAIPVVGMLSSWVQLGEQPSQSEIFGIVSIALGLAVLSSSALFSKKHVKAGSDYSN
jgi:drug/metabolite transporter (DMT)-like permease